MAGSDYVYEAVAVLGGCDTEFILSGYAACHYDGCDWSVSYSRTDAWDVISNMRDHWDEKHATHHTLLKRVAKGLVGW